MSVEIIRSEFRRREQERLVRKALNDPFWLATEVLGFDKLRGDLHGKIMKEEAERDWLYFKWQRRQVPRSRVVLKELQMMRRGGYKTTMRIVRVICNLLRDPSHTFIWWHAVEDRAKESVQKIGRILQTNTELRKIIPLDWRPPSIKQARKWAAGSGFDLNAGGKEHTMRAFGAGSEATGGHCRTGIVDDPIGLVDIEDSLMPKKRHWLAATVTNVIDPDGRTWVTATHWDEDDIYMDMRQSKDYEVHITDIRDEDGVAVPHRAGQTPAEAERELREIRRLPGMTSYVFSCQYELNPLSPEALRWKKEYEQTCTLEEAMAGPGTIFVLSDPAPMGLGLRGDKDKARGEAGKDWWSIAVLRLRWRGDMLDHILLDGDHSDCWTDRQGYDRAMHFLRKWRPANGGQVPKFFDEDYGGAQLWRAVRDAAFRAGLALYMEKDGKGRFRTPQYSESYIADAKKSRMQKLCDIGADGAFWACKSCPEDFLEGDGRHTGLLTQMRKWIPLSKGRNNLKWDDDFDVVARSTDGKLRNFLPVQPTIAADLGPWADPLATDPEEVASGPYRSRYCLA